MTQKTIAFELGISINAVGNLAANAHETLDVHGAPAAVDAHRDAHFYCGTSVEFGPIRERRKTSRSTSSWLLRDAIGRGFVQVESGAAHHGPSLPIAAGAGRRTLKASGVA